MKTSKNTPFVNRPMSLEPLEGRRHLSITALWYPDSYALRIDGDGASNTIVVDSINSDRGVAVTGNGSAVTIRNAVNGAVVNTSTLRVDEIVVHAYEGNDRITINKKRDTYVRAGEGNDTIYGADSAEYSDKIYGGSGNDLVGGRAGNDILYGDNYAEYADDGHDEIQGGAGNDTLYGRGGEDTLYGHSGDDFLWGGSHADELTGGAGFDYMYGQSGNDWINAQDGNFNEYVSGGEGRDTFVIDKLTTWFMDDVQFDDNDAPL